MTNVLKRKGERLHASQLKKKKKWEGSHSSPITPSGRASGPKKKGLATAADLDTKSKSVCDRSIAENQVNGSAVIVARDDVLLPAVVVQT
jgi:hypothetical protein